jgi:excisionase family DNA binding protein
MIHTYEVKQASGLVARDDRRLSVKEAAARAGVSTKTVRRKIDAGDLAGYRVRGTNRIVLLVADVDEVFALERVEPRIHHAVTPAPERSRRPPSRGTRDALRAIEEGA